MDAVARFLLWLEPYLAWGLEHLESGSPLGLVLAVVAGVALGLTPATYPMVPAVIGYVAGEEKLTRRRGLATVGWTDGDLVPEVHAKEKKCRGQDRHTRRSSAARRSGWCVLQTKSTPYPG